jgi:hypothetical protein
MFFAQMGSNSTQTRGGRIAWLLARPKSLNALVIAAGRDNARRGEHLQQLEIARMQPKVRDELRMKPFLRFPSKPEHAAFGIAQSG